MKKQSFLIFTSVLGLTMMLAACGSNDESPKKAAGGDSQSSLSVVLAPPALGEIAVRNAETARYCRSARRGTVCSMNYQNAVAYCTGSGGRLPNIKEWAAHIISRSDSGEILNTAYPGTNIGSEDVRRESEQRSEEGYNFVWTYRDAQAYIDFYYRAQNYHGAEESDPMSGYWASETGAVHGFVFDAIAGRVESVPNDGLHAVRCVTGN